MPQFSLHLYENVKQSNAIIANITKRLPDWNRSYRDTGGCWLGGGTFDGTAFEMRDFFLTSLFRRIEEKYGGEVTWEGLVVEMELTHKGQKFVRSIYPMANYGKVIYQFIGPNLFTDGSAESSSWVQVGTPSTHEFSTTWFTKGTQSVHVVTDAADEGTQIEAGLSITVGRSYLCRVSSEITSGTWILTIHRTTDDTVLASRTSAGTGKEVLTATIPESNDYGGGDTVYIRITADASSAEAFFDAAVFQLAPFRKDTKWFTDTSSLDEYGRIERILVRAGMTDAQADGKAADIVTRNAQPRSRPPDRFTTAVRGSKEQPDSLRITFGGYAFTMAWLNAVSTGGTDDANNHISNLVSEAEFISAGVIATNSAQAQVEEHNPITLWDAVEDVVEMGDGAGANWMGGVFPGRVFNYEPRPTTVEYHYRNGEILTAQDGFIEPWRVRPGLCKMVDMPTEPTGVTGTTQDDPRVVWLSEVQFFAADNKVQFTRERIDE